jgi:hypothetical protein
MWPIARSTPVFRQGQPRTNKRKCGIQPANQSLITASSGPALTSARSIAETLQPTWQQEGDQLRAQRLTRDIRVLWPETEVTRCPRFGRDRVKSGHNSDIAEVKRLTPNRLQGAKVAVLQTRLSFKDVVGCSSSADSSPYSAAWQSPHAARAQQPTRTGSGRELSQELSGRGGGHGGATVRDS